jgi:hypothetical protein
MPRWALPPHQREAARRTGALTSWVRWSRWEARERAAAVRALRKLGVSSSQWLVAEEPRSACPPWKPSPVLRPVPSRPVGYFDAPGRLYSVLLDKDGHFHLWGSRQIYRRIPRWEWPPTKGRPVHGWRARLVALALLDLCLRQKIRLRRFLWWELHQVVKGQTPFALRLKLAIEATITRSQTAWRCRHRPRMRLDLRGLGQGRGPRLNFGP